MSTNHSGSVVESSVQQFWNASLAWKGDKELTGVLTYSDLLQHLRGLCEEAPSPKLLSQIDDLAMDVIHAKRRRKRKPPLGKTKVTRLKLLPNNSGHQHSTNTNAKHGVA